MPPIHDTAGAIKNEIERAISTKPATQPTFRAGNQEKKAALGDDDCSTCVSASLIADNTTSTTAESATMAASTVVRAAGRMKKAAITSAITSDATGAFETIGRECGRRCGVDILDGDANGRQYQRPADQGSEPDQRRVGRRPPHGGARREP
jgi:hypothetical protein